MNDEWMIFHTQISKIRKTATPIMLIMLIGLYEFIYTRREGVTKSYFSVHGKFPIMRPIGVASNANGSFRGWGCFSGRHNTSLLRHIQRYTSNMLLQRS